MKYYIEEHAGNLRRALEDAVLGWPEVDTKKMFGCPSFMAAGKLFAFVVTKGIVLTSLSEDEREGVRAEFETQPFTPGGSHVKSWVLVPMTSADEIDALLPWIEASYEGALAKAG